MKIKNIEVIPEYLEVCDEQTTHLTPTGKTSVWLTFDGGVCHFEGHTKFVNYVIALVMKDQKEREV